MQRTSSLAILGGTFDPPHIGHLILAECARLQFGLDRVLFIPAGDPYRKADQPVTAAADRLAMTAAAINGNPAFVLDEREVRRTGPSYTVDTLEEIVAEGNGRPLLLLGTDALADLPNWRQPERIAQLARIVVARRDGAAPDEQEPEHDYETVDMPLLRVSSSELRNRVAAGKSIRYLVPSAVEAYISEHGLYRAGNLEGLQ